VEPKRVYEVDMGTVGLEQVSRPVPPISALQGHLGLGPGLGDRHRELHGVVQDLLDAEHLAFFVHPDDHRAPPVQVDAYVLARD
jgi:hypothetical protein